MRKYFTSGLAILLPMILTLMIISFLINFLTQPFLESTTAFVEKLSFFQQPFIIFHETTLITLTSKAIILVFLCGFILLNGRLYSIMSFLFKRKLHR